MPSSDATGKLSAVDPAVLPYAQPESKTRRLRHFHLWVLPLVWLPGALGSRVHYGDEYFAFIMANLPAGLIVLPFVRLFKRVIPEGERWFPMILVAGFLLMAFVGWLLDRLRARRWVYLVMPIAFVAIVESRVAVPGHVPPIADFPGQQWEWDAIFVAYCWTVYGVALLTLVVETLARPLRWRVRRLKAAGPARWAR